MAKENLDRKWIRALKQGDFEAFDQIFHAYHRRLFRFFYRLVWDERSAEKLMQEVFVQLWRGSFYVGEELSLETMLYRISKNVFVEHLKKEIQEDRTYSWGNRQPNPTKLDELHRVARIEDPQSRRKGALSKEFQRCAQRAISEAIRKLGPWQRLVFVLLVYQSQSIKEISQILDSSEDKVRARAASAELELARMIGLEEAIAE